MCIRDNPCPNYTLKSVELGFQGRAANLAEGFDQLNLHNPHPLYHNDILEPCSTNENVIVIEGEDWLHSSQKRQ